ncbi:sigma-70 family RNA polymerase sigma factor [Pontiellaceae bacterium B1224]|nr:sigma-70 family RNA polymerase sigma factor [Pontiellaceae bacterium B1224]
MFEEKQTSYTLLQRACDLHDEQAWVEFSNHYRRFIYYILNQMGVDAADIEDISQQVLILLTRDLERYDRSKARFRTWLSMVIRNAALTYFRTKNRHLKRIHAFGEEFEIGREDLPSEIDQWIEAEWEEYVVEVALERVRDVFKGQAVTVFEMGMDGLSAAEVADKTGLSVASVYTLRKRVKKRLFLEVRALVAELEPPE